MAQSLFNPEPSAIRTSRMLSYRVPRPTTGFAGPSPSGSTKMGLKIPRLGRADGGGIPDHPDAPFTGPIYSKGGGRTDDVPMHVPSQSYVVPADVVSHVGEGNSMTGLTLLKMMFGPHPYGAQSGPYGASMPAGAAKGPGVPMPKARISPQARGVAPAVPAGKHGGHVEGADHAPTPIMASGGEFVIPPDEVRRRGGGDFRKGHKILDAWVLDQRRQAIETLKKLPGPAQ